MAGCASHSSHVSPAAVVTLPTRLNSYFEDYCDYTGNLGIGFDPAHTYDYRFRQHLKQTQDPELKRFFVLRNLFRDVEIALRDFQAGIVIRQDVVPGTDAVRVEETQQRIEGGLPISRLLRIHNFAKFGHPFRASDPIDRVWLRSCVDTS